jgi:hypothetical protein
VQALGAPVYTREELEERIRELALRARRVLGEFSSVYERLSRLHAELNRDLSISTETLWRLYVLLEDLKSAFYDAVDEMIVSGLGLDVDIEKYERAFGVKFGYGSERQLGVALLREGSELKPVVIWTDYEEIGYYTGESE